MVREMAKMAAGAFALALVLFISFCAVTFVITVGDAMSDPGMLSYAPHGLSPQPFSSAVHYTWLYLTGSSLCCIGWKWAVVSILIFFYFLIQGMLEIRGNRETKCS